MCIRDRCYLDDRVDHALLDELRHKLQNIQANSLTMAQESVAEDVYKRQLWYNGRKAAGGRLPWLGPRPASCGTAARSTRSPRGVAQQPQRQRTAPVGGRPSNNLNPGRPSGDATKRSCLYD